jgi:hypothetical protein
MSTTEQQRAAANERQRRSREKRRLAANQSQPVTAIESQPVAVSHEPVTTIDAPVSGECVAVEAVTREPGRYPLAPIPSGVTPARARGVTRLANGQFPKRAPLCKPATPEQFAIAVDLMAEGSTFAVIRKAAGADWQAINEYGLAEYPMEWPAVNQAWRESRALALVDKATDIALQQIPASVSETEGAMGRSVTRVMKTDPALLTAALAGLLPQIHGRAAGRGTVNVTANNAAIYAPCPPGTLEDCSLEPYGLLP